MKDQMNKNKKPQESSYLVNMTYIILLTLTLFGCVVQSNGIEDEEMMSNNGGVSMLDVAGDTAGGQAGAEAGEQAGAEAGEQAGAEAGEQAGAEAGEQAGAEAGEQAGAEANGCELVLCERCPLGQEGYSEGDRCCLCRPVTCEDDDECEPGTTCVDGLCEYSECTCDDDYSPVCGEDGMTYSNACNAECQNVDYYDGPCESLDCECPVEYNPVCGVDNVTYPSECIIDCAQIPTAYEGVCESDEPLFCEQFGINEEECEDVCFGAAQCLMESCESNEVFESFFEVCSQFCYEEGPVVTQMICDQSSCEAVTQLISTLNGGDACQIENIECNPPPNVEYYGIGDECELIDYACPPDAAYYSDECGCGCIFRQDCDCPDGWVEQVCSASGQVYDNPCLAACSGERDIFSCDERCECPEIYAPVCGLDGRTYSSSCLSECAGVPVVREGICGQIGEGICGGRDVPCEEVCTIVAECFDEYCTDSSGDILRQECTQICDDSEGGSEQGFSEFICSLNSCEHLISVIGPASGNPDACQSEDVSCPEPEREAVYFSHDIDVCGLIGVFECEEGGEAFSNFCGCGCQYRTCPEEGVNARYVNRDPEICAQFNIDCPPDSVSFSDECGCGCSY